MNKAVMLLCTVAGLLFSVQVDAQKSKGKNKNQEQALVTVNGEGVYPSEFLYIYDKTNTNKAAYDKASLEEYLDLYIKFKLKVQKARQMGLDTVPALMEELNGYRQQLTDSYLLDKEVTSGLVLEAYEHAQHDLDISHMFFVIPENPTPEDTLIAYQKALGIKRRIEAGEDFGALAAEHSADRSAVQNKGRVGFITALFPNGLYNLEKAAYSLQPEQLSEVIRTDMGYHLVRLHAKRPARGEIEVGHILIRISPDREDPVLEEKIQSVYQKLKEGADFDALVHEYSEDNVTAGNHGYIGWFGIGQYEPAFEDAAFSLPENGSFSRPVRTSVGWHIIQRIDRRTIQPFEQEKSRLEQAVKQDARFEGSKLALVEKIKTEAGFKEMSGALVKFESSLDSNYTNFRWRPATTPSKDVLFTLGGTMNRTIADFEAFNDQNSRKRLGMAAQETPRMDIVKAMYDDFVRESVLKYQEQRLQQLYPDFRNLMREYEEGILLFEATRLEVWDKAATDSLGLVTYFEQNREKYKWEERAVVDYFYMDAMNPQQAGGVRAMAMDATVESVLNTFNTEEKVVVIADQQVLEKSKAQLPKVDWKAGAVSALDVDEESSQAFFVKISEIMPPALKTLEECRGYVIADYQDYLEKRWVETLRKNASVEVNKKVLESLVKN